MLWKETIFEFEDARFMVWQIFCCVTVYHWYMYHRRDNKYLYNTFVLPLVWKHFSGEIAKKHLIFIMVNILICALCYYQLNTWGVVTKHKQVHHSARDERMEQWGAGQGSQGGAGGGATKGPGGSRGPQGLARQESPLENRQAGWCPIIFKKDFNSP